MRSSLAAAATLGLVLSGLSAGSVSAQMASDSKPFSIEVRGTGMLPTFDIADAADFGYGGGVGIGYHVNDRFRLMADVDIARHGTPTSGFNIDTYHYMAKVGLDVWGTDKAVLTVNLGAGAVTFGGDLPESYTYLAINAGAKLGIKIAPSVEFLISPQGDIAFSDEAELGTSNSWVWPLGIGLRFMM